MPMKSISLLFFILLLSNAIAFSQNTIGIPNIVNYPKQVYNAGSQNWNIVQDKNGIMYFANSNGMLSFDGSFWRMYTLPNKTIARSLAIGKEGRIYIGGQGEIGYFFPDDRGELRYTSLNTLIPKVENDFADVWNICIYNEHIFFRASKKILEYDQQQIKVYRSDNWGFLGISGRELLANDIDRGLVIFRNGEWQPRVKQSIIPKESLMRGTLPIGKDSTLIITLMDGLFILHGEKLAPFQTPDINAIVSKNIYGGCIISPERIALLTTLGGCNVIDKQGRFIQRFTKKEGVQNNNILCASMDKDRNLWLGLDNGIDLITYGNAIKNIFPDQEDRNTGYTSLIHDQQLFLGVSSGVYKIYLAGNNPDLSYLNGTFDFVGNTKGQVWGLSEVNGKVLMGHNKGAYLIENGVAQPIENRTGFWNFQPLYDSTPSSILIGGTYSGLNFFNYANGTITNPKLESLFESARFVVIDKGVIWAAHPYKGLYKIIIDKYGKPLATKYVDKHKFLSTNHNKVFKVHGKVILTTDNGIFEYDHAKQDFIRSGYYETLFEGAPVSYLKDDPYGNTWFCRDRKLGIVDRSGATPRIIFIPEIDERIMANGFEHINIVDSNNIFVAAEKGFYHINYSIYRKNKQALRAVIRNVQSMLKKDALIYGGYDSLAANPRIEHAYNALRFECASTLYGQEQNTEYSYYLEGFDKTWSNWSARKEKDYTNLPAGSYVFKVKCRNNFDNESPVSSFSFSILPPWYQTWWAYSLYIIALSGLLYIFYERQQRKYKRLQQQKLQEQQRKYVEEQKELQMLHQIEIGESEKQIIELKNEKLQAEVAHKNSELASSAMNLVRKKEMLSKLRSDLVQYKETDEPSKGMKEFQKIIRVIDKELDHDQEWEQFAVHFDSVHTNYLKKLKDYYPELSPSDLKLAAYLRLNLTSKEIAQLMNISIRGVETSRYRLRKKLGLMGEENLFDFLIEKTKGRSE